MQIRKSPYMLIHIKAEPNKFRIPNIRILELFMREVC